VKRRASDHTPLLAPGSFVRLKSGGPVGVVADLDHGDYLLIIWITEGRERSLLPGVCVRPA
jgi:uncharacterized protein YodC (DUF2158 family)